MFFDNASNQPTNCFSKAKTEVVDEPDTRKLTKLVSDKTNNKTNGNFVNWFSA